MKIYRGKRVAVEPYPYEPVVSVETNFGPPQDFEKLMLEKSLAIRNHSPTGFEWGYGGSGPHQLALALLMDATGNNELAERFYNAFVVSHVIQWGRDDEDSWEISDEYIRSWVMNQLSKSEQQS